ncbi:MAG: 5-formyltetrahydrofolate cyclo-ligase [Candidatus Binatia bacterium]
MKGITKERLRAIVRERLASLSLDEREGKSNRIAETVARLDVMRRAERLLLHQALPSEVATERLLAEALAGERRVFAPRVDGRRLTFLEIGADTRWQRSALGVLEPQAGEQLALAAPGHPSTVVLVPGLAFDEQGGRLGRGGGHYDDFLREARRHGGIVAIAMAFELQVVAEVPREAHDEPVDVIVTEARVIEAGVL